MADEELWGTDAGFETDYEGTIIDAFFQLNTESQFGDPQTQLRLKFLTDTEKEVDERYNCGKDWVSNDGGDSVSHPSKVRFNRQSQAGKLVDALIACGAVDAVKERGTGPTVAKTWLGLRFFMESVDSTFTPKDGEPRTSSKNYPSKFLGIGDVESSGSGTATPVASHPLERLNADDVAKVISMAKTLPFGEWLDKLLEVDGVLGNDDLVALAADENGLYTELRNR